MGHKRGFYSIRWSMYAVMGHRDADILYEGVHMHMHTHIHTSIHNFVYTNADECPRRSLVMPGVYGHTFVSGYGLRSGPEHRYGYGYHLGHAQAYVYLYVYPAGKFYYCSSLFRSHAICQ